MSDALACLFDCCSYGDFIDYAKSVSHDDEAQLFDVVVTCFFVDTAANILDYLLSIKNVLSKGGVWINLGPLHVSFQPCFCRNAQVRWWR